MTFETWMEEISKGQEIRGQETRRLDCAHFDAFDEDDEEEEQERPRSKKH